MRSISHSSPIEKVFQALEARGCNPRKSGRGWQSKCPSHDDKSPSLSVTEGRDGRALVKCHAGCEAETIVKELGLVMGDLFPERSSTPRARAASGKGTQDAVYRYTDADGKLLYEVVRYRNPKSFRQRRPDGSGGHIWNLTGVERVLYRLPEIREAVAAETQVPVLLTEGEKDADNLVARGFVATTAAGGASAPWLPQYSESLRGADVVIVPDNDGPGRKHCDKIGAALKGIAQSVRVLTVPEPHKDISDWINAGADKSIIQAALENAPEWAPGSDTGATGEAESDASDETEPEPGRQADKVLAIVRRDVLELLHTKSDKTYAVVSLNGKRRTLEMNTKAFRRWAGRQYYEHTRQTVSAQILTDAIENLQGEALFNGTDKAVYLRVAEHDGAIILDLGSESMEAVRITQDGWEILPESPVPFPRKSSTDALPVPKHGGSVERLRPFVNVGSDADFRLMVAWLVAAFRPVGSKWGAFPILVLQGEQGSAKSTTSRVIRSLIDPARPPDRSLSREERDLVIAASNSWVLAFDNLSVLAGWISDAICRLATGTGFASRQLYTDGDEAIFEAKRPLIVNGIEDLITRPDLADRSIVLNLPSISEESRRDEADFWPSFEAESPYILGALCDAVSCALRRFDTVKLPRKPRMADFARWVTAAEPALGWDQGAFLSAYEANRYESIEQALESDPVAAALRDLATRENTWLDTVGKLLERLTAIAGDASNDKGWPRTPKALTNRLKRLTTALRSTGLGVSFRERTNRGRLVRVEQLPGNTVTTDTTSTAD